VLDETVADVAAILPVITPLESLESLSNQLTKVLQVLRREPIIKNAEGVPTLKSIAQKAAVIDLGASLRAPTSKDGKRLRPAGGVVLDPIQFAVCFLDRTSIGTELNTASTTDDDWLASCVAWDGHAEGFSADVRAAHLKCNAPRINISKHLLDRMAPELITGCASVIHRDALPSHPDVVAAALGVVTVACTTSVGICRLAACSALANVVDCFVASVVALDARWPHMPGVVSTIPNVRVSEVPNLSLPLDITTSSNSASFYHLARVCVRTLELIWVFLSSAVTSAPSCRPKEVARTMSATVSYFVAAGGVDAVASLLKQLRSQDAGTLLHVADLVRITLAMQELVMRYAGAGGVEVGIDASIEGIVSSAAEASMFEAPSIALSLLALRDAASDAAGRDRLFHPSVCAGVIACFRVINSYAERDPTLFQAGLASVGNHMVIRNVIDEALRMATAGTAADDAAQTAFFDVLMREVLRLVCHYAEQSPRNRDSLNWGTQPTTLQRLCELPFRYFSEPKFRRALFPALIIATNECPANVAIVSAHLSFTMLQDFVVLCESSPKAQTRLNLPHVYQGKSGHLLSHA
jgi:hypothetical protein